MNEEPLSQRWTELMSYGPMAFPLDEGWALLSYEEQLGPAQAIDDHIQHCLLELDQLAAKAPVVDSMSVHSKLSYLCKFLFKDLQFMGDKEDYHNPLNSLLHALFFRKKGIPISLSAFLIEIGRRVGIPIDGIGFPGHFLVQPHCYRADQLLLDPFSECRELHKAALQRKLKQHFENIDITEAFRPVSSRQILMRMSNNLFQRYRQDKDPQGMYRNISRIHLLDPQNSNLYRVRSSIAALCSNYLLAASLLESYIASHPDADDIEDCLRELSLLKGIG